MCHSVGFPCSQCGLCCRHLDRIPQMASLDRGDGVCVHLRDNLCGIYETRPELCRVDEMYEKYFCRQYSREEYYRINQLVCEQLQRGGELQGPVQW